VSQGIKGDHIRSQSFKVYIIINKTLFYSLIDYFDQAFCFLIFFYKEVSMSKPEDHALASSDFNFTGQQGVYHGKVRDVYDIGSKLVMVASDRISAFDHILPRPIPYKGQVLNLIAKHFLNATSEEVPNWLIDTPDPNVSIGIKCEPIKLEMVIRGYLAGHAWRTYKSGEHTLCGVTMPDGMKEAQKFPDPIITPATKAEEGHDEDISEEEILSQGLVTEDVWEELKDYTTTLFEIGSRMAQERGLILVDTKYEFGVANGQIYLIDEIHTPDSSRYYYLDGYAERLAKDEKQKQLSKEFVREWLMEHDFQGLDGHLMPEMPDDFVWLVSDRYIELYEHITGLKFEKADSENINERIFKNVEGWLSNNK